MPSRAGRPMRPAFTEGSITALLVPASRTPNGTVLGVVCGEDSGEQTERVGAD
jgi:hypothetical protein